MAIPDEPLTRGEQYLAKTAGQDVTLPDEPLTRMEQYLAKIAGQDVATPDVPQSRVEQYLDYIAENGGGGSSITVEPLTVTQNGTQTAPSGKAYSPVTVNVPNSYTASDIGKVVASALVLVDQDSAPLTMIANGERDTTYIKRVIVNVQPRSVYGNGGNTMLSNPFSELDFNSLYDAIQRCRLSGYLYYKFNGMLVQVELYARDNIIGGMAFVTDPAVAGVECEWNANGVVKLNALMSGQVQDMRAYASQIQCYVSLYGTDAPTPAE